MFKDDTDPMSYFRDISTFGGCTGGPAAAIENMKIIEEEDLRGNSAVMGEHLKGNLQALMEKHKWIGDVRGMGLFAGAELVQDRTTKEPVSEKHVAAIVADCMAQGVIIGATNRSVPGLQQHACVRAVADCDSRRSEPHHHRRRPGDHPRSGLNKSGAGTFSSCTHAS